MKIFLQVFIIWLFVGIMVQHFLVVAYYKKPNMPVMLRNILGEMIKLNHTYAWHVILPVISPLFLISYLIGQLVLGISFLIGYVVFAVKWIIYKIRNIGDE